MVALWLLYDKFGHCAMEKDKKFKTETGLSKKEENLDKIKKSLYNCSDIQNDDF